MKEVKIRVITVKFGRRTISLLWFATQLTRAIQEVQFCSKIKISKKKSMTASSTFWKYDKQLLASFHISRTARTTNFVGVQQIDPSLIVFPEKLNLGSRLNQKKTEKGGQVYYTVGRNQFSVFFLCSLLLSHMVGSKVDFVFREQKEWSHNPLIN